MNNNKSSVAVIIPNWNGQDMIGNCIDSLMEMKAECSIIVVENGSIDNSKKILKSYGNRITVLSQTKNMGFAEGVNIGIRYALDNGSEFVALLNNDATVDKNWLKELLNVISRESAIGIVTSRILSGDGKYIDSTGDYYTRWGLPYPRGRDKKASGLYMQTEEVFGASGGASLYRSSILREIGLFDKRFFAYFEDVDLSYRARLYGWKIYYCAEAIVHHGISKTSGRIKGFGIYHTFKNFPLVFIKNTPLRLFLSSFIFTGIAYIGLITSAIKKGKGLYAVKGFFASILLLPYAFFSRWNIQKNKRVSTDNLMKWITFDIPAEQTGILKLKKIFRL